jgi:hypothetical protein
MIRRVWLAPACLAVAGAMSNIALAQTAVTWDGGNGSWFDSKWNGGQAPAAVMGNESGGNGGYDITIGGGSQVLFVAGDHDGIPATPKRDLEPNSDNGPTTFTITGGAKLTHTTPTTGDEDGQWTPWDVDLNLDNGTFERNWVSGGAAQAGGILMFGSWASLENQLIKVTATNGGLLKNDGQVWFGADKEHALGLKVSAIINNGSWDLTGGNLHETKNNTHDVRADLALWYGRDFGEGAGATSSGDPKGEDYEINFQGPGSLTVDQGGIVVYRQAADGTWNQPDIDDNVTPATRSSYEDLWNEGILRAKGMTGGYYDETGTLVSTGQAYANFFTETGTLGAANYKVTRKEAKVVTWSGGATGSWHDSEWDTAGGASNQAPADAGAFGQNNGFNNGSHAVISGATVNYDASANGDFRTQVGNGIGKVTLQNGGVLALSSSSDPDGLFTRWGSDLTIDGPGSKLVRTKDGVNSFSGGKLMFGAYDQKFGQEIDVVLSNGGSIDNDGELYFGRDTNNTSANAAGLAVTITIDGGSMNLRGGDAISGGFGYNATLDTGPSSFERAMNEDFGLFTTLPMASPSLMFIYTDRPTAGNTGPAGLAGEEYVINFTGPGSITVDHAGILVAKRDESALFTAATKTYEQLWADGILQANGLSGLDGAIFGDFFTTMGTLGSDNYKLTSKLTSGPAGDFDSDGDVDGADFLRWQRGGSPSPLSPGDLATWKANFGSGAAAAAVGAVPEPTAFFSALVALCGLGVWRSRR